MTDLDEFHTIAGKTIMYCQRIEYDIKLIYAGMLKGNFDKNLEEVQDRPLGYTLNELQNLDNSDNNPYFSEKNYNLLREIKNIRNWLVHKSYTDFIYSKGRLWNENYNKSFVRLNDFYNQMSNLANQVEKIRLEVLKHFGRL